MFGEERSTWRKSTPLDGGTADVWIVGHCAGFRVVGYLDLASVKKIAELMNVTMAEANPDVRLVAFCDYSALSGADPDARQLLQDVVKRHKERFEIIHYLVSSKLIALAVQVAGLWHGIPTKTWTSPARLELEFVRTNGLGK